MSDRISLIERRLRERIAAERVEVLDDSAQHAGHAGAKAGGHFSITVVSPKFSGLNAVQRHRLVYDALDELMRTDIHALSIRALTPAET
jgi:BolA family transcriptional regulator, general stress-responsive regulator